MTHRIDVLIVESHCTGHRLMYVRLLIEQALRKQLSVAVLLGFDHEASDEYAQHIGPASEKVVLVRSDIINLHTIKEHAESLGVSHVVIPTGDRTALRLGTCISWNTKFTLSILVMRDPSIHWAPLHAVPRLFIKRVLLSRAGRRPGVLIYRLRSAGTINPSSSRLSLEDPVQLCYTSGSVQTLRTEWGLTDDRFWFGVVGAISQRKNVPLILQCLRTLQRPVGLLIAGVASDDSVLSRAEIDDLRLLDVKVIQVNRNLTDIEIDSAIKGLDCVLLLHSNEGPSGILGKSAAAGTRVVAGGAKSLKQDLAALAIGIWVPLEPVRITDALESAMNSAPVCPVLSSNSMNFEQLMG